jgi:branched-chain amino acid aminotransferase
MLTIEYSHGRWHNPKIIPYGNLNLSPASSCLHYGTTCFEGMKAYKEIICENNNNNNDDEICASDNVYLFRPDLNMVRLKSSMQRLAMPGYDFDSEELIQCIMRLVDLDSDCIPSGEGYSLYIRPNVLATNHNLGVSNPTELLLYVITSPVGPYFKSGFKPVKLLCSTEYVRAFGGKGGTGGYKIGGNYAPTLKPGHEALDKGYQQVLWVNRNSQGQDEITEVGAMNLFLVFEQDNGRMEIVTPPLDRGDILPGVTRKSIVELTTKWKDVDMVERNVTMQEVQDAVDKNRFVEAFGAGTAAVVCPIECIHYKGVDLKPRFHTGDVMHRVWRDLLDIQYGKIEHEWARKVVV